MILNHVANGAGLVVESSPALDAEVFGHRDLDTLDVIAIPERLDKGVRETKDQQVVHRPLSQIVIDSKNVCLVEGTKQDLVQLSCGLKIMSERFFDDNARAFGAARLG